MINKDKIMNDIKNAEYNLLIFEERGNYNQNYKPLIENYKREFIVFKNNIKRLSDNIKVPEELQISINNFVLNMNILSERLSMINKQNK